MLKAFLFATAALVSGLLSACATQRYGRQTGLSPAEAQEFTCREIRLETAKAQEFLHVVRAGRSNTNAAHVLGFLGDFGIGNALEGDEAEASGEKRLVQLNELSRQRCGN